MTWEWAVIIGGAVGITHAVITIERHTKAAVESLARIETKLDEALSRLDNLEDNTKPERRPSIFN
jgi:hypothetical protein